jgi:hypothetical protein
MLPLQQAQAAHPLKMVASQRTQRSKPLGLILTQISSPEMLGKNTGMLPTTNSNEAMCLF